jgi:hypothetical protein
MSDDRTRPDEQTREAERAEAEQHASAGRMPTAEEEAAAEGNEPGDDVAEHEREMVERGAHQKGEGRLP